MIIVFLSFSFYPLDDFMSILLGNRNGAPGGSLISPPRPLSSSWVPLSCVGLKHSAFSTFKVAPLSTMCPFNDIFCWIMYSTFFYIRGVPLRCRQSDLIGSLWENPICSHPTAERARASSPDLSTTPVQTRPIIPRLCPALTGSRVVSGALHSCQNVHDIIHIINNYRLFTDGRADGHTTTEICLISARLFPRTSPFAHSCCLPGGKN